MIGYHGLGILGIVDQDLGFGIRNTDWGSIFCFDANNEIYTCYWKLGYSFCYASLTVVRLLDY